MACKLSICASPAQVVRSLQKPAVVRLKEKRPCQTGTHALKCLFSSPHSDGGGDGGSNDDNDEDDDGD